MCIVTLLACNVVDINVEEQKSPAKGSEISDAVLPLMKATVGYEVHNLCYKTF